MTHEPSPPLPGPSLPGPSFWWRATLLVLARPRLWWTAVRQALRLARRRWWTRAPFLPLPDPEYLRFRFETQYGADRPGDKLGTRADPRDLVTYLEWCREMPEGRRLPRRRR